MIIFADVPLLLEDEDGEVARFLSRYQNVDDLRLWGDEAPYRYGSASIPNWPAPPRPKINTLYWPTGATRWARGLFLATTTQKDQVLAKVGGVRGSENNPARLIIGDSGFIGELPGEDDFQDFKADERDRVILSTQMYLLPPRPISVPGASTETLWLLPLVDERFYWQYRFTETFEPETWAAAFTLLEEALDVTLNYSDPEIPSEYGDPPSESLWEYASAAIVLDAVSNAIGRRVIRELNGDVRVLDPGKSTTRHEDNLKQDGSEPGFVPYGYIAGDEFDEHAQSIIPAVVGVTFSNGETVNETTVSASDVGIEASTSGTKFVIHTGLSDPWTGDAPTDAHAELAGQIAEDFYAWLSQRHDITFSGIKAWHPSGFDDHLEWSIGRRREDGSYEAQTRVQSVPYNFATPRPERHPRVGEIIIGILEEGIAAADNPYDGQTSATMRVLVRDGVTQNRIDGETESVVNRSTTRQAGDNTVGIAAWSGFEWLLIDADCEPYASSSSSSSGA